MIELTIDNMTVQAHEGETVLQAALKHGIEIPHFCYHPCLSIAGNCRVCLVKVDGRPKLMPSCNLEATPGMRIETVSEEVLAARAAVMQFIILNHPGDCGICDKAGECRVQDYHVRYGEIDPVSIEPKHRKPKLYDLSPRISLDNERCILCSRCVRFTREVSGSHMLGIVERGCHSRVARLEGKVFDDPYSDNIISICPTGALLSRDFLYKSRVWYLEPVRSVCTGCARCCSVNVWRRRKRWHVRSLGAEKNAAAYRITPGENPEINGHWICNKGFDLHKAMGRPRALAPLIAGRSASVEEALQEGMKMLSEAVNPAALISAHASNEELEAFRIALGSRMRVYTREDHSPQPGEVLEDDLLIRADKNPNSRGVRELFGDRPYDATAGHDLVLVWGDLDDYAPLGKARILHLTSFVPPQGQSADLLIPISTVFERSGTFTNFEGKANRFDQVFDKPKLVQHAGELFGGLAA
ncbi:MAG: ferredoxin [Desulfuromonadales bacterium]|nr:MAG: ferredoxin [Desulfuromonadales bacterium]